MGGSVAVESIGSIGDGPAGSGLAGEPRSGDAEDAQAEAQMRSANTPGTRWIAMSLEHQNRKDLGNAEVVVRRCPSGATDHRARVVQVPGGYCPSAFMNASTA